MSFQNLSRSQNNEAAKLLMGLGKALVLAGLLALIFPASGEERPVFWSIVGIGLGGVAAGIGVLLFKDEAQGAQRRPRRNRG